MALLTLTDQISEALDQGVLVIGTFLDFSKAPDSECRRYDGVMVSHLMNCGVPQGPISKIHHDKFQFNLFTKIIAKIWVQPYIYIQCPK